MWWQARVQWEMYVIYLKMNYQWISVWVICYKERKRYIISIPLAISYVDTHWYLQEMKDLLHTLGVMYSFITKEANLYYQYCSIMIVDIQSKITCRINMNMDKKLERFKTKMYPYLKAEVVLRLHRHYFMEDIDFTADI